MKLLLATQKPFSAAAVAGIKEITETAGHEFALLEKYPGQAELIEAATGADALIVRSDKVSAEVIESVPSLKIVVRAGAGYDNVDLDAATAHGVVVMNTPGQNANAVAELVIAMMIYMSRGQFTPATGSEIMGKKLGLQAFGNVARLVGEKAKALGMSVMAIDPYIPPEKIAASGVTPAAGIEELYSSCDFVSVHIPATPETIGSIGYDLISRMPTGGTLINSARKEVVDEVGLVQVLRARPDLKYACDVAPDGYQTLKEEFGTRIFATPKKMGAQTAEANINAGLAAARQIVDFFATGNTRFQVNK